MSNSVRKTSYTHPLKGTPQKPLHTSYSLDWLWLFPSLWRLAFTLFFPTPTWHPCTMINITYLNQECQHYIQTNTAYFKVFNSGFKSANLKALYKQVILAIPGRKISISSAKPRGWLAPIAQLVTLTQQLCFCFTSKGTVWAKQGSHGAMNPLIDQREVFPHKCFICY